MEVFGDGFGHVSGKQIPELESAIERAVSVVEPRLKHLGSYPDSFRKPVSTALDYVHWLATTLPGPVDVGHHSYTNNPLVSSLFPSMDHIHEGFGASYAMVDYQRKFPAKDEFFALMGMRRNEKVIVGDSNTPPNMQRETRQITVTFNSHTIEDPAPTEKMSRIMAAESFFGSLVNKVKHRIGQRIKELQLQTKEKYLLEELIDSANTSKRAALDQELTRLNSRLLDLTSSLELKNYLGDFEAVMLHPEEYLRIVQIPIAMSKMAAGETHDDEVIFNDLIGYDRRDWTVTMIRCSELPMVPFIAKGGNAGRRLAL